MQTRRKAGADYNSPQALLILIAMAFVAFVLAGGYYYGGTVQSRRSEPITVDAHFRETALRNEVGSCNLAVAKLQSAKGDLHDGLEGAKKEVEQLQSQSGKLYNEHELYESQVSDCSVQAESARREFDEDTERQRELIKTETVKVKVLRETLDQLTEGRGSRLVLEIQSLKAMRKLHFGLRKALQSELPVGDDTLPTIEAELLTKWGAHLDNETLFASSGRKYEMMNFVKKWAAWEYDPATHTEVAAIKRDSSGNVARPTWKGAAMKVPLGTDDNKIAPVLKSGSLASTMVAMYEPALCSYRRNVSRIPYPSAFMWFPTHIRSQLSAIVDAPVLTFCYGCPDPRSSGQQFTMACGASSAMRLYGSYQFWSMRSLFRFTQEVYNEADRLMAFHGLEEGNNYVAIVNHVSSTARIKCHNHERINYGPHRLWIEHNFGTDSITHMSSDREVQCAPSETDVRKAIEADGRGMLGGFMSFKSKVYLSVPDVNSERVAAEAVTVVSIPIRSAFDEAVDMVIASRAKRIIVSPFFSHSQIVTELFLLRNELDPQGVRFF